MRIQPELFTDFAAWLKATEFPILGRTGEKTLQHQLALYLHSVKTPGTQIELEVNTNGLLPERKKLTKREIDIFWKSASGKHAVELKFCRDAATYNIYIFSFLQDVRFGEELIHEGFTSFGALFFTDVKSHFTPPRNNKPGCRNIENFDLYNRFRVEKRIHGSTRIKTGAFDATVELSGSYPIAWNEFSPAIQFTSVCIDRV